MNNVQAPDYMILKNATKDFSVGLIRYLAECKFFICFENQLSSKQEPDGLRFVTQKILSAFIAGSIPSIPDTAKSPNSSTPPPSSIPTTSPPTRS